MKHPAWKGCFWWLSVRRWSFCLTAGGSAPLGYSFLLGPSFYDLDCIFHVNAWTFQITIKLLISCFCNSKFHRLCEKLFHYLAFNLFLCNNPLLNIRHCHHYSSVLCLILETPLPACYPLLLPASVRAFLLLLRVHVVTLCSAQSPLSI